MKFAIPVLAFLLSAGCHDLTPAQSARLNRLECQARALAPLVEPIYNASELIRDVKSGKADLNRVLRALQASEAEVEELVARLEDCE